MINQPYDGSMLSYGLDNLNIFYRYTIFFDTGAQNESSTSKIIRQNLSSIDSDVSVGEAASSIGARYILLLGRDQDQIKSCLPAYRPELWGGINSIDDETPGFSVVLEHDDMRLYEIDGQLL